MCAGGSGRVVSPRPSSSFHPRETASLRKSPLPPLVLQAAHVGEVLPLDEHAARADGLPEIDDGVVRFVVVVVADLGGVPALHDADGTVAEGCAFPVVPYRGVEATRAGRTTAGRSAERRR